MMRNNTIIHVTNHFRRWLTVGVLAAHLLVPVPASAEQRVVDTKQSTITVHVFKSGLLRAFADNHVIQAPLKDGFLDEGSSPRVVIIVGAQGMRVVDPGLSPSDRDLVQARMLGPEVLDANRFPQIRFESVTVQRLEPDGWLVRGRLTLHGQTHLVTVKGSVEQGHYRGAATVKQTDFGMSPISVAGGTVKVKDEVQIDFDIVAALKPVGVD